MYLSHPTNLSDSLENLDDHSGANDDYRQGMILGMVSTLMAGGATFGEALSEIVEHTKVQHRAALRRCICQSWKESLDKLLPASCTDVHGTPHFVK